MSYEASPETFFGVRSFPSPVNDNSDNSCYQSISCIRAPLIGKYEYNFNLSQNCTLTKERMNSSISRYARFGMNSLINSLKPVDASFCFPGEKIGIVFSSSFLIIQAFQFCAKSFTF